eukprot:GFKZ01003519.1.p1 GENE.GFKZ01003519.1~~GFKZ01003519.1.p1  ORF type:complete len:433 (+),score=33.65 GFKZ01003519.1:292-1590(+)
MTFSGPSQFALHTSVFLSCISFAIVMPSLWPYLSTLSSPPSFLAIVVATYSIGEGLGALYFGHLSSTQSTRSTTILSTTFGLFGSLCYMLAELFPNPFGLFLVLLARFLQGVWTGAAQAIQNHFLADVLPIHELTPAVVTVNAYATLGFVVGPVFGLMFSLIPDISLPFSLHINELTGPGHFVLLSSIVILGLYTWVFDEESDRADAPMHKEDLEQSTPLLEGGASVSADEGGGGPEPGLFGLFMGLVVCNLIFFVHFFGFAVQETVTTPFVQQHYGWSVLQANLLFTAAGVCALVAFAGVQTGTRRGFSDRGMTLFSLGLGLVGFVLLVPGVGGAISECRFLYGFMVISVAFPVGRATTAALYTKLLPMKEQGRGQGVILAVGAVARILGPFCAVRAVGSGSGGLEVFGGTAVAFLACAGIMGVFYARLKV